MKSRLHLQNATHFVEWPVNSTGAIQALNFRKSHSEFKYKRIRTVLQAYPEQIPCNQIIERTN